MTKNQKIISVVAVIFVGVVGYSALSKGNVPKSANISVVQPVREINVKAFQFGYEPNVINARKGEKIKINIDNIDVLHGIRIPDLGLSGNEVLEFTANQTGEFTWYCANACGGGHQSMQGKLIIEW